MAKTLSSPLTIDLTEKIILLTGGYGYLGKSIAENILAHNAKVYILGRSKEKFHSAFQKNYNNTLLFQHCDISESKSFVNAYETIFAKEGKIDAIINNAFYSSGQHPEEMLNEDWSVGIDGSLNSIFRSIKASIPLFKKLGKGKIINVASMYGMVAPDFDVYENFENFLNPPHYGAAKAGVIQLTKYYASYLGKKNITVNCISPGPFPSKSVQKDVPFTDLLANKTALGRIGQPEELAGIFTFLASDASNYITGQNFIVDGGWTIKS